MQDFLKQCWCENRFGKWTHQGHCKLLDLGSRFCASPCGASHRSVTRDASMIPNNSLLMGKMRVGAVAKHLPGRGEVKFILPQGGKGSSGAVWKHTGASSKTSKAFSVTSPCETSPSPTSQPKGVSFSHRKCTQAPGIANYNSSGCKERAILLFYWAV